MNDWTKNKVIRQDPEEVAGLLNEHWDEVEELAKQFHSQGVSAQEAITQAETAVLSKYAE